MPLKSNSSDFSFRFLCDNDVKTAIVAVLLLLLWGISYMSLINNKLYLFFNATVFNSLLGAVFGMFLGGSKPFKAVVTYFLPWQNFENNILPFMIIYPACKLCSETTGKQLKTTLVYALLRSVLCVALNSCGFLAYLATRQSGDILDSSDGTDFRHVCYAMHVSASVCIYDAYLCVHNYPEIRGNSHVRGFLSSQCLFAMCVSLELRQLSLDLALQAAQMSPTALVLATAKRALFVPLVSFLLGITAGLISSFITKHSSFLHVQQEMVVLPCSNYIAYTVAQKTGLSPIVTSIACEVVQGSYSINNVSEASKITYKSLLAKASKVLGFFSTLSFGFFFGSFENRFVWKYVSPDMFGVFLGITIVTRIFSSFLSYWCVKRLGFAMRSNLMFLQTLIHTRTTPSLMSIVNLHYHSEIFGVCLLHLLRIQWSLYAMCMFVNVLNVPLVGAVFKRLKIEPDITDNRAEPIFRVIFRLMYHELHEQIVYLSGSRRRCEIISQLMNHAKKSFVRHVMSLGFMSIPERTSHILSAYDQTISQKSNVIDQRRKSVKSKNRIFATQRCASFIVRNLSFEGFHADDIADYFLAAQSNSS